IMLPSETMIWQPEFTDKTLSRKTGAVHSPDYGGKFLNGPVSTTRAGRITGNEILPRTAPK
ncbi:hypothetical protein, partial [Escherichia coli]|uniref:hypothetical protein n=2 Tax=Escherichia coli TaxID=562 RepID=UPI0006ACFD4C